MRVSTAFRIDALKTAPRGALDLSSVNNRPGRRRCNLYSASIGLSGWSISARSVGVKAGNGPTAPVVHIRVPYRVQFGEVLRIVGSSQHLGGWSAEQGLQLTWTEGDVWTAEVPIVTGSYEFKCVVYNVETKSITRWEDGGNRVLTIPEAPGALSLECLWGATDAMEAVFTPAATDEASTSATQQPQQPATPATTSGAVEPAAPAVTEVVVREEAHVADELPVVLALEDKVDVAETAETAAKQVAADQVTTPGAAAAAAESSAAAVVAGAPIAAIAGMPNTATATAPDSSLPITTGMPSSNISGGGSSSGGGAAAAAAFLLATCAAGVVAAAAVLSPGSSLSLDSSFASAVGNRASTVLQSTATQSLQVRAQLQSQLSALAGGVSAVGSQVAAVGSQVAAVQPVLTAQVASAQGALKPMVRDGIAYLQGQATALQPLLRNGVAYVQDQAMAMEAKVSMLVAEGGSTFRRG